MIKSQRFAGVGAILAGVAVSVKEIFSGEGDFGVRNAHVLTQANHRRHGEISVDDASSVLKLLCFSLQQQNDRSPPTGEVKRFVGGIQHQNLTHYSNRFYDDCYEPNANTIF